MNIGLAIKEIRISKNISQGELASLCNLSQTSLSQIESGIKRPNPKNLAKICNSLNVSESFLYLYGLDVDDVPESKKETFKILFPSIKEMMLKVFLE